LKDRAKWAVDYVGREVIVGVPLGLLFFAATFSAYPLVAFLACGGLFLVLMLRRVFRLDKPIDDPTRIAATRSPIMQDGDLSWNDPVNGALGYLCGEAIVWVPVGLAWLALGISIYLSVAIILCWVALLFLMFRQYLIRDIQALDDPKPNSRASRLIAGRDE
jgi:hypothetical protein